jgi:hypothetical protein
MLYFQEEKVLDLGSFKSAKTANHQKRLGLRIKNPQSATFVESPQI